MSFYGRHLLPFELMFIEVPDEGSDGTEDGVASVIAAHTRTAYEWREVQRRFCSDSERLAASGRCEGIAVTDLLTRSAMA